MYCFTRGTYKCSYSIYYLLHLSNWSASPEIKQECVIGNREQFSRLITAGAAWGTPMHGWFAGKRMSLWCSNNKVVSTQESPAFPYWVMEGCGVVLTFADVEARILDGVAHASCFKCEIFPSKVHFYSQPFEFLFVPSSPGQYHKVTP